MNLNEVTDFDEVFDVLLEEFPELKLHVRRVDERIFATASSSEAKAPAIVVGSAYENVGLLVRAAVVDLFTKQVVADLGGQATDEVRGLSGRQRALNTELVGVQGRIPGLQNFAGLSAEHVVARARALGIALEQQASIQSQLVTISDRLNELDADCSIRDSF